VTLSEGDRNPSLKITQAIADTHGLKLSKLIAMAEKKYERSQH
jgi:hypothetical protein